MTNPIEIAKKYDESLGSILSLLEEQKKSSIAQVLPPLIISLIVTITGFVVSYNLTVFKVEQLVKDGKEQIELIKSLQQKERNSELESLSTAKSLDLIRYRLDRLEDKSK